MDARIPVNSTILDLISRIDHFRGVWAGGTEVPPDRLHRLREVSRVQSVAASCRIAGIRVTDPEAASIMSGAVAVTPASVEIAGYSAATDRAFPSSGSIITLTELAVLNAVIVGTAGNPPPPSALRETPIHLEVFDSEGRALGRVLHTLPPRVLRDKTEDLVSWLELELRGGGHHPLLVIGAFFLYFTAISPFERGNGRLARVMVPHLMRRAGYGFVDYASVERVFDELRLAYYEAIDAAETKLWTEDADLTPWLQYHLEAVHALTLRLQAKIDLERRASELPPLQRAILDTIREHGTGAAALLMASTGANRNTLKDNLRRLVDRGLLERVGTKRGTFYRLSTGEAPLAPALPAE